MALRYSTLGEAIVVIEGGGDGPDYQRICHRHAWASLPAATPDDTGRCARCSIEMDAERGATRYLTLVSHLPVESR